MELFSRQTFETVGSTEEEDDDENEEEVQTTFLKISLISFFANFSMCCIRSFIGFPKVQD
jgi:hypothetical protein